MGDDLAWDFSLEFNSTYSAASHLSDCVALKLLSETALW